MHFAVLILLCWERASKCGTIHYDLIIRRGVPVGNVNMTFSFGRISTSDSVGFHYYRVILGRLFYLMLFRVRYALHRGYVYRRWQINRYLLRVANVRGERRYEVIVALVLVGPTLVVVYPGLFI